MAVIRKAFLILILLFIFPILIYAEEADRKGLSDFWQENVNASLEYKFFGHFQKVRQDDTLFVNEGILKLDTKFDFREKTGIVLSPVFRADDRHFTSGVIDKLKETDDRRYYVNFKEAYFVAHGKRSDFYFGKKVYSWGNAEGFNPTDDINPYDFLDFPDREKIGVFSAAIEYARGDYSLDAVFIPFFTPSRLPEQNNRWAGNMEDDLSANTAGLPALPDAQVEARQLPPNTLRNSQFGGRLRATLKGWDLALSYYHGLDSVPAVEEKSVGLTRHYTPKFNEIDEYGFATATTFDKLELHAEASYRDTAAGNDDDFIAYIAGGNYIWDELGIESIEKITLYFEYAGEEVTNEKDNPQRYSSSSYSRPFRKSVLGSLIIKFNEDVDFAIGGNYNIDEYDHYIQPKLTYKLSDKLKLKAGLDIMTGHKDTFWGKWRANDRVFTNVIWYL